MKKRFLFPLLVFGLFLAVLFIPVPQGSYDDGGTKVYSALSYKIVDWKRLSADGVYTATKVYWFPNNFKSIDALWAGEEQYVVNTFVATVLELHDTSALVQPAAGEPELQSADRIHLGISGLEDIGARVGSRVKISYTGGIMESYPAQIHAIKWELLPPEQDALSRDP